MLDIAWDFFVGLGVVYTRLWEAILRPIVLYTVLVAGALAAMTLSPILLPIAYGRWQQRKPKHALERGYWNMIDALDPAVRWKELRAPSD